MASHAPSVRSNAISRSWPGLSLPRWTQAAWGAIATTAAFLAITCWWLTQDRSIPIFDAGLHLQLTLNVYKELTAGHLGNAFTLSIPYPPFAYLIGSLGLAIGGISVASPVLAENFVFVPLLALGCYNVGRLTFGPTAGFLAVVFALGSPLIISLFHVVMIDGPETAMVAVSLWAILASERFSRIGVSAAAGVSVGLGMLTKEPFAFFVAGPLLVIFLRGGWRSWRGILAFAIPALAIALPWYIHDYQQVHALATGSFSSPTSVGLSGDIAPHHTSLDNFEWYAWNLINAQLNVPLFAFAAIGWIWALVGFLRRRSVSPLAPEMAVGAFVGWLAITETFAHDTRYSLPLMVYLAVFGTGWITRLPRRFGMIAAAALVVVAVANTAGIVLEAGQDVSVELPGAKTSFRQNPGKLTFFTDEGFLAGKPSRDGDILATLRALRRSGVRVIVLKNSSLFEPAFSAAGLGALAQIAGLTSEIWNGGSAQRLSSRYAVMGHAAVERGAPPPCVKLRDGTGVWIALGNPEASGSRLFCPDRKPQFYG